MSAAADLVAEFQAAMAKHGIVTTETIIADGKLHRLHVEGDHKGSRNGFYVLHLDDHPAGAFGCYKRGVNETWKANGAALSDFDYAALKRKIEKDRRRREQEEARRHESAAADAIRLWTSYDPAASDHPYILKKRINPFGARQDGDGRLVLPLIDTDGKIWSLQTIDADGGKLFMFGGRKAGCFYMIGNPGERMVIAEGFATASTIREATGLTTIAAFDAGNLQPVAKAIRAKWPGSAIVIAADDDRETKGPPIDNPGIHFARIAAASVGAGVAIPRFKNPDGKSDFNDLHAAEGPAAVSAIILAAFPAAEPESDAEPKSDGEQPADDLDEVNAEVARLAKLHPVQCDREMKAAAKRLGCRASTLQGLVARARGDEKEGTGGQGSALELHEPEPWQEQVNGAQLIEDLVEAIGRLVIISADERLALALWVIFSHAINCFEFAPRLIVTSPEPECGKTTLLAILLDLCTRPLPANNVTAATTFRTIEKYFPTLLLDEADTYLRDNEEMRGVLNSGHRRDLAYVLRLVEINRDYDPRKFSTWCAMAIAGLGRQHVTIESRSIRIELIRKLAGETVDNLDDVARAKLRRLARRIARWVADNATALRQARPENPLRNRAADNWQPLLAIAATAGGEWPAKAKGAAVKLVGASMSASYSAMLLEDIRDLFIEADVDAAKAGAKAVEEMQSTSIVAKLLKLEHRPWAELGRSKKPLTTTKLANMLSDFKIAPKSDGQKRLYKRAPLEEAWKRYLPPPNPSTRQESSNGAGFADSQPVSPDLSTDGLAPAENPATARVSDGMTGWEPSNGGARADDDGLASDDDDDEIRI